MYSTGDEDEEDFVVSQKANSNSLQVQHDLSDHGIKINEFDLDVLGGIAIYCQAKSRSVWISAMNNGAISVVCYDAGTAAAAIKYDIDKIKEFLNHADLL